MDRINGADTTDIGSGRRGFRAENLVAGVAGTEVTAEWLNGIQEEILRVVTEAGLTPNSADWSQLWQALKAFGLSSGSRSRRWMAVISMSLSSAPGSPAEGDAYLIPAGATGIWAANVGKIAEWSGSAWTYFTPTDGHGIALPDGRIFERIGGAYLEKLALDTQSGKWIFSEGSGSANAITASLTPAPLSLASVVGAVIRVRVPTANTASAVTLNVNGFGAIPVVRRNSTTLRAGDIRAGMNDFVYDGTYWRLMSLPFGDSTISETGYIDLPGGLTMQWGTGSTTGGTATITFPKAFSNTPFSMCATDLGATGWSTTNATFLGIGAKTATTAVIRSVNWTGSAMALATAFFGYMAIGPT